MKRSQREAAASGSSHLLRLSLPAVRSNGPFEGADILGEAGSVPAILLCQVYRVVMAWALTPAAEHDGLFPPSAAAETRRLMEEVTLPEGLRPALDAICRLAADPVGADARRVAEACAHVGEWAERKGDAPATALRFLQAAATCSPNDPRLAYRAGYIARRGAVWDVAELWFRHSSTVGRRIRDWEAHATAYLALGNNYYYQGKYSRAKREHTKALRVSKRHGLRELQGRAYHDLMGMAILTGEDRAVEPYAERALQAYGARHANVPLLAHDVAYFWHTHGQFARALRVYRALLPHVSQPTSRLMVLGSIGREAGECGYREIFAEAWQHLWDLIPSIESVTAVPPALVQVAHGAIRLEEWDLAESAVNYALEIAHSRGESDVVSEAEHLLSLSRERSAALRTRRAPHANAEPTAESLANELVSSLEATAVPS